MTQCGNSIFNSTHSFQISELDLHQPVINAIENHISSKEGAHLKIGQVKKMYNDIFEEEFHYHSCYNCGRSLGNKFMEKVISSDTGIVKTITLTENWNISYSHWCYSEDKRFCHS